MSGADHIYGIDEYKNSIEQEPGINFLHLACLFFLRKDATKTGEYMQKLTPERIQEVISWSMTHKKEHHHGTIRMQHH